MTDNEKQGIKVLVEQTRGLCKELVGIMQKLENRYGIKICSIHPDTFIQVPDGDRLVSIECKATYVHCYSGIEKVLEAMGCTGIVDDEPNNVSGEKYLKALYDGDTPIFQISRDGIFEKALPRDNKYTREASNED